MPKPPRISLLVVSAALVTLWWFAPAALAQGGARALVAPGDTVPKGLLLQQGGPVGRELAAAIGVRPIIGIYWRPGDALSEMALTELVEVASAAAPKALLAPIAVVAAGQSPNEIADRLQTLGVTGVAPLQDSGQLARVLGVREIPSLLLLDAAGVLRLVGGSSVTQSVEGGATIGEAIALAGSGKPVPTLGRLPANPIYKLLGKDMPPLALTALDGAKAAEVTSATSQGKRLLIFYWLPTCSHCKRELPALRRWYEQTRPKDLVIIDIAQAPTPELQQQARDFIASYPWPHYLDVDRSAGRALLVRDTPASFLIAPDAEILGIKLGAGVDWSGWLAP